jgi:hypothetical protein
MSSLSAPVVFDPAELAAAPSVCAQLYTPHASSSFAHAGGVWDALLRTLTDRFTDVFVVTNDNAFGSQADNCVVTANLEAGLVAFDRVLTTSSFQNDVGSNARRFLLIIHWDDEAQLWKQDRLRRLLRDHASLQLSVWFSSQLAVLGRRQLRGHIQVPTEVLSASHVENGQASPVPTEAPISFWICSPSALVSLESNYTRSWTEALRADSLPASSEAQSFFVRTGKRWAQLHPSLVEEPAARPVAVVVKEARVLELQRKLACQQRRATGILAVLTHVEQQHVSDATQQQSHGCSCAVCWQELSFRPASTDRQPMVLGCGDIVCLGCLRAHVERCSDTIDDKMQDLRVPEVASQILQDGTLACMLLACPQCQQSVRVVIKPRT